MVVTTQVEITEELSPPRNYHAPNKTLQNENSVFHNFNAVLLLVCKAQEDRENIADSMTIVSRTKADKVLLQFNTIAAPKLLYSLDNKVFYVIIKSNPSYQEYYVTLDSLGRIDKMRLIKVEIKTKKQRKQQEQYRQLLSEAEPIFDLNKYHTNFITKMPNAKYTSGRYSYFVVKDIDGKRYGEYRLSAVTSPSPINTNLWLYIIRRLSDEISKVTHSKK